MGILEHSHDEEHPDIYVRKHASHLLNEDISQEMVQDLLPISKPDFVEPGDVWEERVEGLLKEHGHDFFNWTGSQTTMTRNGSQPTAMTYPLGTSTSDSKHTSSRSQTKSV